MGPQGPPVPCASLRADRALRSEDGSPLWTIGTTRSPQPKMLPPPNKRGFRPPSTIAISMYGLTDVYGDLNFWFFARSRMVLGVGLPLIFIPIIAASYDGIPPNRVDMASVLINAARNTGGSIGVSIASNVVAHREQFHQARLIENAVPASVGYQDALQQVTKFFQAQGSPATEAQQQAVAWIGQEVTLQASFLAYVDVFWVLMTLALLAVPLAMSLRKVKLGGAAPAAH